MKKKYFRGNIPPVAVLDAPGSALYNRSGEVGDAVLANLLDKTLGDSGLISGLRLTSRLQSSR